MVANGVYPSICRLCLAFCPIDVEVRAGRAIKVAGDRSGTPWNGYICPKGRALPEQHNDSSRILRPRRRNAAGGFDEITTSQAIDEVSRQLGDLVRDHGPQSVALYIGTGVVSNPTGQVPAVAFMRALGSPMIFSAATLDKPAANVSTALHGNWIAGSHRMEDADAWMVIGANPVIAKSNGAPPNNPGVRLKEAVARGMRLIVIDPRETETARRATHHLRVRPGEDPALLAGLLNVILSENLIDADFLQRHAEGLEALRQAVAPFDAGTVPDRTGVPWQNVQAAARDFAAARIGGTICGTGPSFATRSNLTFYLALCLNTVCGHWPRAGQRAPFPNMLLPKYTPREQAYPPYPALGTVKLSATGLSQNASGMPTAGLSDQMLSEGPDRVRALICVGGNPPLSWPDQPRTERALRNLDLLVTIDYHATPTTEVSHYIIPPPLTLEIPGYTQMVEWLKYIGVTRGMSVPWAQYTPAIVAPPEGSDLMDEGEFLCHIAQRLNLDLTLGFAYAFGPHAEAPAQAIKWSRDEAPPSVEDLLCMGAEASRIPLDEVKRYPRGHLFDLDIPIEPAVPGNTARLQLGDPMMMDELAHVAADTDKGTAEYPLTLLCRRVNNFMNSVGQGLPSLGSVRNPVSLHPDDLRDLGLEVGDTVTLSSPAGTVSCHIEADATLLRGTVTLTHGFGWTTGTDGKGTSVEQLVGLDEMDPVTGIPRMSAIPVRLVKS
jgi:anaerobic selenocysteine-containing dehydrogenase